VSPNDDPLRLPAAVIDTSNKAKPVAAELSVAANPTSVSVGQNLLVSTPTVIGTSISEIEPKAPAGAAAN